MFSYYKFLVCPRTCLGKRYIDFVSCFLNRTISSKTKNHYETLKLSQSCSSKEIRDAFITLSKKFHPDKNKDNPNAQEEFIKVNEAYNTLIKPESRRDYDFSLQYYGNTYKSPNKGDYYEVHRHNPYYRDPWKDPSFARNRKFSEDVDEDNYYGIKGIKRKSNESFVFWLITFVGAALLLQIWIIRFATLRNQARLRKIDRESKNHLAFVTERANLYETREDQIEAYKQRMEELKQADKKL